MNCPDLGRLCNETLDARAAITPGLDPALEAHAASCPSCRATAAGYQLLGRAFAGWPPPPPASAESLARLRLLPVPQARTRWPARRKLAFRLASAASILALAWLGFAATRGPAGPDAGLLAVATPPAPPAARPIASRPLDAALADATRATIDFARDASAPAARLGREALDFRDRGPRPSPAEKAEVLADARAGPSGLLEAVGERVNAGVRPISGSARHAFSFLLAPISDPPPAAPAPRDTL